MKIVNPTRKAALPLTLREQPGEYRVRLRKPLKGKGVVTRRRVLVGHTLRPKTRLTAGIFQKRGRGKMELQALAFPKPTTAASARRKARKITGRVVNPGQYHCKKAEGEGDAYKEAATQDFVTFSNPDRRLSDIERFHFMLVRALEDLAGVSTARAYRTGLVNALLAVDGAIIGAYRKNTETGAVGDAIAKTWRDLAKLWKLGR